MIAAMASNPNHHPLTRDGVLTNSLSRTGFHPVSFIPKLTACHETALSPARGGGLGWGLPRFLSTCQTEFLFEN